MKAILKWISTLDPGRSLVVAAFFYLFIRFPVAMVLEHVTPGEQAYIGVVSKELLSGDSIYPILELAKRPNENGSVATALVATPLLLLFKYNYIALRLTAFFISMVTCLLWVHLARTRRCPTTAFFVLLLLSLPPPFLSVDTLYCIGNHPEMNFFIAAGMLLLVRIGEKKRLLADSFLLGLLTGFGIYFNVTFVIFTISTIAALLATQARFFRKLSFPAYLLGGIAGFSPWIYGAFVLGYQDFGMVGTTIPLLDGGGGHSIRLVERLTELMLGGEGLTGVVPFFTRYLFGSFWIFTDSVILGTLTGTVLTILVSAPAVYFFAVLVKRLFNRNEPPDILQAVFFFYPAIFVLAVSLSRAIEMTSNVEPLYLKYRFLTTFITLGLVAAGFALGETVRTLEMRSGPSGEKAAAPRKSTNRVVVWLVAAVLVFPVFAGINSWVGWFSRGSLRSMATANAAEYFVMGTKIIWDNEENYDQAFFRLKDICAKRPADTENLVRGFADGFTLTSGEGLRTRLREFESRMILISPELRLHFCCALALSLRTRLFFNRSEEEWEMIQDRTLREWLPCCSVAVDMSSCDMGEEQGWTGEEAPGRRNTAPGDRRSRPPSTEENFGERN